jgi:hypothetical protein
VRSLLRTEPARTLYLGGHTLARMRPRQVAGILERHARERLVPALPVDFDRRYERRVPADPPARTDAVADNTATIRRCLDGADRRHRRDRARAAADGEPQFLNRSVRIADGGSVDWAGDRLEDLPLQWRLKLYGFEPLSDALYGFDPDRLPGSVRERFDGWIRGWADEVAVGGRRYLRRRWTPWAVSLRIQRWLRYLAFHERHAPDADFERTLRRETYKNACFLRNHVEFDVDGNHLVENGVALLAAGLVFDESDWTDAGTSVLETAAREQFLADGCHYERSPMYHVVVLTRLLTARDLLARTDHTVPDALNDAAAEATAFLRYLRPPDGELPLLNDSVHGESLSLEACRRYATAVGVDAHRPDTDSGLLSMEVDAGTSGYRWLRTDAGAMLVDGGPVGPSHLPGHSHSDTLSVLLWVDGRQVITDTGTFDYTGGPRRNYARGVRAHNTVQVGDVEPIPLGGQYLLGPRPAPETRFEPGDVSLFEGRYEARPLAEAPYTHHRAVYAADDWWLLDDAVAGDVDGRVRSRLHLHPDVEPVADGEGLRLETGDRPVRVRPLGGATLRITDGRYYPRFGEAIDRAVVETRSDGSGSGRVRLALAVDAGEETALAGGADGRQRFRIDGRTYELPGRRLAPR